MIEASIGAVPGLIISFLVLAAITAIPAALICRACGSPALLPALAVAATAGIVTVTLLPSSAGISSGQCDAGMPRHVLTSSSALLNIALFVPATVLAVTASRRPVTIAATFVASSGGIEFLQSVLPLGRACSVTDMVANSIGSLIGTALGVLGMKLGKRPIQRLRRDAVWGIGVAAVSAAILAGSFQTQVRAVDAVAIEDRNRAYGDSLDGSDEWIRDAAVGVFGKGTQVTETSAEKSGQRSLITAVTNRGPISGWWPDRTLVQAWATDNQGDEGKLSEAQAGEVAHSYAQKWFPDSVQGSTKKIRQVGEDHAQAVYAVTYRRYVHDVMMPMRLDVTVTKTGRIMGFTSKPVRDPVLPPTAITEKGALRRVAEQTRAKPTSTKLLAQQVRGKWRPVWLIGVNGDDVFIDAATGQKTQPDR
ncbi:VanZ family protein [Streptomyces sp. NBC_01237]|uniref:VanZ family protein n=1 Tax=Streptomyces sp. NBC_01237 TaxID=2903790 RepID=UPI002DDA6CD9|nr:VanZ family protein [Streptomyces sp. NBC_01237]WRZ76403.1 VanZ family protein [Streptomyces sp. NBC_01237]